MNCEYCGSDGPCGDADCMMLMRRDLAAMKQMQRRHAVELDAVRDRAFTEAAKVAGECGANAYVSATIAALSFPTTDAEVQRCVDLQNATMAEAVLAAQTQAPQLQADAKWIVRVGILQGQIAELQGQVMELREEHTHRDSAEVSLQTGEATERYEDALARAVAAEDALRVLEQDFTSNELKLKERLADLTAEWTSMNKERDTAVAEAQERDAYFDMRWKADHRAIRRWRAERPEERDLLQPDHADLVLWLAERDLYHRVREAALKQALEKVRDLLMQAAGVPRGGQPWSTTMAAQLTPSILGEVEAALSLERTPGDQAPPGVWLEPEDCKAMVGGKVDMLPWHEAMNKISAGADSAVALCGKCGKRCQKDEGQTIVLSDFTGQFRCVACLERL